MGHSLPSGDRGKTVDSADDIRQWRKTQRNGLLVRRAAVPREQHQAWTAAITGQLVAGFPMLKRMIVGFYWPFQGEFDPRFAIRRFREGGATAALPVVVEKRTPLQFREWWPGVTTTKGVFNLPVPEGTRVVVPQALLIPPVGFDARGYRLGYGGGYFDRTLAAMTPQPLKIGVAFELSRLETIHPQAHDIAMDFIVTEAGIYHVAPAGLQRIETLAGVADLAAVLECRRNPAGGFSSPPCYAQEFDYWQEGKPPEPGGA
jgi:5-formyltetrahydrofolate cyclo-ligase